MPNQATMAPPPQDVFWGTQPDVQPLVDDRCRAFSDDFETLPRARWSEVNQDHLAWHVYDQVDGMCTSNAGAGAVMFCREVSGMPRRVLAPTTLYGQHSRWGTGSSLAENVDALLRVGVCAAQLAGEQVWPLSRLPSSWQQDAARHRILPGHVWNLRGLFDRAATALQRGFAVWIGVNWPGGGGHSVLASSLRRQGNTWYLRGPNSWGRRWNGDGFWNLSEAQCASMSRFGAYAVHAVVES